MRSLVEACSIIPLSIWPFPCPRKSDSILVFLHLQKNILYVSFNLRGARPKGRERGKTSAQSARGPLSKRARSSRPQFDPFPFPSSACHSGYVSFYFRLEHSWQSRFDGLLCKPPQCCKSKPKQSQWSLKEHDDPRSNTRNQTQARENTWMVLHLIG